MTNLTASRVFNKSEKLHEDEVGSLGFCRIHALPAKFRVTLTFAVADKENLCVKTEGVKIHDLLVNTLGGMNAEDFKNWIKSK